MNIFRALFGGRKPSDGEKEKEERNFDVLKYDGVRALKQGQLDYSVQCFTHALELDASDLECRDYLSRAYIGTGNLAGAYEQLQRIAEARPDNVAVLLRIAEVAFMMENYTAMTDVCEKALLLDGDNVQTYYLYARACRGLGDLTNATAMLTKVLNMRDDFEAARLLRGEVLLDSGDTAEAAADADLLCQRVEDNEDVLLLKARVEEAQGNPSGAEAAYGKVIDVNPFCIEAFDGRAAVRRELGDEAGAKDDEITAEELRGTAPQEDGGIEKKVKERMKAVDPYGIFNQQ